MNQPRKIAGWPVKDIVLLLTAGFAAFGTIVGIGGSLYEGAVAGIIGVVWFFLGMIWGYGEATGI